MELIMVIVGSSALDYISDSNMLIGFGMKKYINELQFGDNTKKLIAYSDKIKEQRKEERKQKR